MASAAIVTVVLALASLAAWRVLRRKGDYCALCSCGGCSGHCGECGMREGKRKGEGELEP